MNRTTKQYYIFISSAFSILLIVGIVINHFSLTPYELTFHKEEFEVNYNSILREYVDLNQSGETEEIIYFIRKSAPHKTSVLINDYHVIPYEQFNFDSLKLLAASQSYYDIDKDNFKEVLLLHKERDSVFLSIINIGKKSVRPEKYFLISKPDIAKTPWDIDGAILGFHNKDTDKRFLYIWISGQYTIFPRTLYKYDLKLKQIVKEFTTTTHFYLSSFVDLNDDGSDEIVMNSYSPGNTRGINFKVPYPDTLTWLVTLDKDLNLLWDKSYPLGEITSAPFRINNKTYLASIFKKRNNKINEIDTISFFDYNGNLFKKKTFTSQGLSQLFVLDKNQKDRLIIRNNFEAFEFLDNNLNHLQKLSFNKNNRYFIIDKNPLFPKSLILANNEALGIYNNNLDLLAEIEHPLKLNEVFSNPISYKYSVAKNELFLAVNSDSRIIYFSLKERSLLKSLLIYIPLVIIFNLFLFLLIKIIVRGIIYFRTVRKTITLSPGSIIIVNESLKVLSYNKAAKKFFGDSIYTKSTFLNASLEYESIRNLLLDSKKMVKEIESEIELKNNGVSHKFIINISPIKLNIGPVLAYLIKLEDHTDLIMRERSRVWFHSMQKIAHEIKTPLSSMLLNLKSIENSIEKPVPDKGNVYRDMDIIKHEIDRIKNLTNNLLKFADLQKLNFQNVDLLEIIEQSKVKFRSYLLRGVKFEISVDVKSTIVYADSYQIDEVFQVIIENAIDAMQGNGIINIKLIDLDDKIKIEISDNGPGINQNELNKIFDPYYTTKKEGTGMGLAIAKKIIADHNSILKVISEIEKGTIFTFFLNKGELK